MYTTVLSIEYCCYLLLLFQLVSEAKHSNQLMRSLQVHISRVFFQETLRYNFLLVLGSNPLVLATGTLVHHLSMIKCDLV